MTGKMAAVILAAGSGRRVGIAKHRLQTGFTTFLQAVVAVVRHAGLSPVVCVIAPDQRNDVTADTATATTANDVQIVVNADPGRGMFSSVIEGIRSVGDCRAALLFPVDHPFVQGQTVMELVRRSSEKPDHFIKPAYGGRGGHPVVIPASAFRAILDAPSTSSLRTVIEQCGIPIDRLDVGDRGVIRNINTFEDLHAE